MLLVLKTLSFFLKSILIGVIISSVILLLVPDLREGSGMPLTLFTEQESSKKLSFNSAVNAAGPAVVNIYSQSIERSGYQRRQAVERTNLGSGVIMTSNGYILTCYHVIANAKLILVGLQDGRLEEAQIVGFDSITDLAVLSVSAENLHPIPQLEDPKTLVGDVVLALGNPYNLGQTVTQGIVSRINNNGLNNFFDYIQTDAVLNQGNSGGALVDSEGVLIGINNANFKTRISPNRVESVDGVSFALPYSLAKKVMSEIIATGKVTRGALGFEGQQGGLTSTGIIVTDVIEGTPAELGGLQVKDLILSVNDIPAISVRDTLDYIADTTPGSTIVLEVNRDGTILKLDMVVGELQ
ncbi:trypsin-like peptidase domain-containing protein [Paraglaciecola arctica]|uniref:trypsin-like peptidase domain-containing protein n=1 Tax=Paraglaciecola arctica TaxID=1128911 RepID=UPI001C06A39C|nr:trypsin-like peptidase domain-containing protein [Paraglaciecola arctica]MBU3002253.1 trypsin-like peptidase domain-containing protein [Paraglaciecola arctica]